MIKRALPKLALLLAALFLLLPGCSDRQPAPDGPDMPGPAPVDPAPARPQPDDPQPAAPAPSRPDPEITAQNTVVAEGVWKIDTSYFSDHNMTVDSIFVAGSDRVLFFVSPLNADGTVSENSSVYFFSLETGDFLQQWIDVGVIGVYPDRVYDDGTVSVVTLDSESYEYRDILFIDPQAVTASSVPAPSDAGIVSLSLSPDKRYAALSTMQGLRVTGPDYSAVYLEIPNGTTEDGDELLPSPTDWSRDSRLLSFKMAAWESIHAPFIADVAEGEVRPLELLGSNEVRFVDRQLFYSGWYPYLPCGFCTADGQDAVETPLSAIGDPSALCQFTLSPNGAHLAVALQNADGCDALIFDARTGETRFSFPLSGLVFNEACFTADERTAVFATAPTLEHPKQVYVLDFGR